MDLDKDTLFVGGPDGSINEVSRTGFFLEPIVPAGLFDGRTAAADQGLAVLPSGFYAAGGQGLTGLRKYSRSGEHLGTLWLSGYQMVQGLCFDRRGPTGILYWLEGNRSRITAFTINENGDFMAPRFAYRFDLPYDVRRDLTGLVSLPGQNRLLLALRQTRLLLLVPENPSPMHGEDVTTEIVGSVDLSALGIQTVDDLAYDPGRDHLYLTDSTQGRFFELAFIPSEPFHRGDADDDGTLNVTDAVHLFRFLFLDGLEPGCLASGDTNSDGQLEVSDAVYLLAFLFTGGPEPPKPGPPSVPCGPETNPGDAVLGLGCRAYRSC